MRTLEPCIFSTLDLLQIRNTDLLMSGICVTGSAVGGSTETQECMDFFAEKDIRLFFASFNAGKRNTSSSESHLNISMSEQIPSWV
jgi:D-arabinose 1-dehydrogenase-like Zn-dependent alcohol dehydrogenase